MSAHDLFKFLVCIHILTGAVGLVSFWVPVVARKGGMTITGVGAGFYGDDGGYRAGGSRHFADHTVRAAGNASSPRPSPRFL
jgi:hypothetical protein